MTRRKTVNSTKCDEEGTGTDCSQMCCIKIGNTGQENKFFGRNFHPDLRCNPALQPGNFRSVVTITPDPISENRSRPSEKRVGTIDGNPYFYLSASKAGGQNPKRPKRVGTESTKNDYGNFNAYAGPNGNRRLRRHGNQRCDQRMRFGHRLRCSGNPGSLLPLAGTRCRIGNKSNEIPQPLR